MAALLLTGPYAVVQTRAANVVFYVAPNGNDAWSGHLKTPSSDKTDGPLASLPAALAVARKARRAAQPDDDLSVQLRSGVYQLADPLVLSPVDSGGGAAHPFIIQAFPGETPVISGGRRITGWKPVAGSGNLWQAEIPEVAADRWYFRELFVNGARKLRARTPARGFFRLHGPSPQGRPALLHFQAGEIQPEWARFGDVEVVALMAWSDLRMQIRAVDETTRTATLSGNPSASNQEQDARYYVENAPEPLTAPGEWCLDRKRGVLSYRSDPGENPNAEAVTAPLLKELLLFEGETPSRRPVRFVNLRHLTFAFTDWELGENGYADTQAAVEIHGVLHAEGAVDCAVEDCVFAHLGGYALEFGRGCQGDRIVGNDIHDIGAGGIRLGEPDGVGDGLDATFGNTITDNHIHQLGRVYAPGIGLIVFQSARNLIAHNHIHDLYYTAISVGWHWGYGETPCHDNIIEYNHLHDIGQNMLSDMGAIYTLGPQKGTVIRHNLIHDIDSFTYGGWGIYPDEGSSDILIENNVVYRTKSAGFHQHYGKENLVRNNIFAFGREHQLMRTRAEDHLSFTFEGNIVYFDSGDLLGSNWTGDESKFKMSKNLYFDARPGASEATMRFAGGTLQEWRARGHDLVSEIADPKFVDPAAGNFALRPGSPALRLGFQPIDLRGVGVR